jgi:TRAP transporter TAXI family solute receptor
MRKIGFGFLPMVLLLGMVSTFTEGVAQEKPLPAVVVIATSEPGSTMYSVSVPIAAVLSKYAGFKVSVEPVGPSEKCLPYLERGEVHLANSWSQEVVAYTRGKWWVKEARPWIRIAFNSCEGTYAWMAKLDSGISSWKDMEGKKLACYVAGLQSAGVLFTDPILERHGVKKVTRVMVPNFTAALKELIEGRADVAVSPVSPRMVEAERAPGGMRVLQNTQEDIDYINKKAGADIVHLAKIPPGFLGLKAFTRGGAVVGDRGVYMTHKDVQEEVIYRFVKNTYEHFDEYKDAYPRLKEVTFENALATFPAPYHPGAIRYFKEKRLWKAEHEKKQRELLAELGQK